MKRALIVTLVCLNVALLAAMMLASPRRADAQANRGVPDYIMVTGRIGTTNDAVYVLDINQQRLAAWRYDKTTKRMLAAQGRRLQRDFAQGSAVQGAAR